VQISAGKYHSLALSRDAGRASRVFAFGDNGYGQLGVGDVEDRLVPTAVHCALKGGAAPSAVAAGAAHSLLLFDDGSVYGFGDNADGQLGNGGVSEDGIFIQECEETPDSQPGGPYAFADDATPGASPAGATADDAADDDSDDETSFSSSFGGARFRRPVRVVELSNMATVAIACGSDALQDRGHSLALLRHPFRVLSIGSDAHGQLGRSAGARAWAASGCAGDAAVDYLWGVAPS